MTQSETTVEVVDFVPGRWGNPADPMHLSDSVIGALTMLGINEPAPAPVDVVVPATRLGADALAALEGTGAAVATDDDTRRSRMRGFSTPDLLKFREGDGTDAPDAVVAPTTQEQVAAVLAVADQHDLSLNPFSGGTSVTGGMMPERERPVLSLDLRRLTGLIDLDEVSQIATFAAGTRLPEAERLLAEHGFELGHFPQSYEGATIGGCAVTRSAGQSSIGYGRFDDMVVGLTVATPVGLAEIGTAPKSAAGPDLRQLILGSEGAFGVVTTVRVHVHPLPAVRRFYGWHFPDFVAGEAAMRTLAQSAVKPTVLRLSDEAETGLNLANPSSAGAASAGPVGGCLMVVGFEGDEADVDCRDVYVTAQLEKLGGTALGTEPGEAWRVGRFRGPYLRDPLLDAGALVETLETVTFWSNLDRLKADVTAAITGALGDQGTPAVVMCHISHVYPTGASLYFTVIAKALENPLEQWAAAKNAANAAIRAAGASITHHHAVGTDHRGTYLEEIGDVQRSALRAVKDALDPNGLLNPGILLP
ncbi:FAD-binding oxidoreductase [Gordonia phthalatica]|uniref:Alkyldihydroxyacetonephosphate synthase n=1 Tax=Gordonia phthalatica TaxID=1136941 RepID=A0A0N7FV81_9ACTN|nr:FAD-binding oxidoreductase [Gordonia phthalatica]ALG86423.1 alkyldihydroxyacetonephosphate synthase [Gordonia phthalatica]